LPILRLGSPGFKSSMRNEVGLLRWLLHARRIVLAFCFHDRQILS
jgi:hypothetical protein